MESSRVCTRCKKKAVIRDEFGNCVCTSCGIEQEFDNFQATFGGIDGPQGSFVRVGSSASGGELNYREKKIYEAQKEIDDITSKLGFSASTLAEVRQTIEVITEREYGRGYWFHVFVSACSYVVMRKNSRSLPMAEIASVIGCEIYELGRMIARVVEFLDLKLPEFDIVAFLEHAVQTCPSFSGVSKEMVDKVVGQGRFLLQCSMKWFLTTGRRPLPMVAAVLAFVAELNQLEVRIEDIAKEVHATVATTKKRHKELKQTLVKVARILPWGGNVTVKNIVKNAHSVIQYMERKSMSKSGEKSKNLGPVGFALENAFSECMRKEIEYATDGCSSEIDSQYFEVENRNQTSSLGSDELEKLMLSQECLARIYANFSNNSGYLKSMDDSGEDHRRKRRRRRGIQADKEWWSGGSDLSKKLSLKQILEKNVGFNALPPSFVAASLACKRRREKIKAAKLRINKIIQPPNVLRGEKEDICLSEHLQPKKRKQQEMKEGLIDWEDCIIELLLLHQVKEEEIEQGYYNNLLDLHVFNSGST